VLAARIGLQGLAGGDLPVQMLLPIGGNKTVRGLVQDRYLDRVSAVANLEMRFPVFWRFGGILGYDAGKVWHSFRELDLARWATNPVAGLRFYMDTFVVRLDVGFGNETTGFYLNFGHIF
jgi:hemolysin activation/secretion protein